VSTVPCRVAMTVTGYLSGHLGGFYDMRSSPDGSTDGDAWSIPEYAVDEASVRDLPPERLTEGDWNEITGTLAARLGWDVAEARVARWRRIASDLEGERPDGRLHMWPGQPVVAHRDADLPPDSVTRLPLADRIPEISRRYLALAYSGPTALDRERDTVVGHLLDALGKATARVENTRQALIRDGTADEVGDIAPRLIEWPSHHRDRAETAEASVAGARKLAMSWAECRYVGLERGLGPDPGADARRAAFREARDALIRVLGAPEGGEPRG
jgi:hypothetical protein